ncbi:rRNA methyltransferase 3A, mitochondrial [Nymphon striatum]|nr:rRNA methyltransferase 3A, mitochondrial [Nymphon striatum]
MGQIRLAIQQDIEENEKNEITYETDENGHKFYIDETYLDEDKMELYKSLGMESTPYYDIDIDPKKEINIVIGGETEGLSGAAFRFARKHYGVCANIPLANDIESLNSAVACGILSYHVQNKYLKHSVDYANLLSQNNS